MSAGVSTQFMRKPSFASTDEKHCRNYVQRVSTRDIITERVYSHVRERVKISIFERVLDS